MNTISGNQSEPKSPDDFAALAVIDDDALEKISVLSPDQDPSDFHPRLWPRIRTVDLVSAELIPELNLNVSIANLVNR